MQSCEARRSKNAFSSIDEIEIWRSLWRVKYAWLSIAPLLITSIIAMLTYLANKINRRFSMNFKGNIRWAKTYAARNVDILIQKFLCSFLCFFLFLLWQSEYNFSSCEILFSTINHESHCQISRASSGNKIIYINIFKTS